VINPSICSAETLEKIQKILQMAVSDGIGKPASSKQFNISGKTGTAQISKGSAGYKNGNAVDFLVSFCGYFPSESPQYSGIVVIWKPDVPASGGLMAGSVFGKIAERIHAKNLVLDIRNAIDDNSITIPNVKRGEITEAKTVLNDLNIKSDAGFPIGKKKEVWGQPISGLKEIVLEKEEVILRDFMPNVMGMGAKDIVYLLEGKGLKVSLVGVGKACKQSIPEGILIKKGQFVTIQLK
jgi:cell division protein FtsI (penicillin-binding protein 3)